MLFSVSLFPWSRIYSGLTHRLGEVVEGMPLVKRIEELGSASGKPKSTITIAKSGVV
jgi:hypothetical protein